LPKLKITPSPVQQCHCYLLTYYPTGTRVTNYPVTVSLSAGTSTSDQFSSCYVDGQQTLIFVRQFEEHSTYHVKHCTAITSQCLGLNQSVNRARNYIETIAS